MHAWRHEAAFRQELALIAVLVPIAAWLAHSFAEFLVLMLGCLLVLIVELLNSAIEAAIDRFGGEHHELSGRAKDMGSAAVFLSFVVLIAVWGYVIYDRVAS